ncbi:translation initiation factor IF-2 [Candidatus Falkowbacteria bacterium]|jgi:translation initiation factor IF-2|nr:translation initiation factor IF-2 [Candidatus Falkowbacteria bacterium]MBT4433043.1 translation initiation factor IF-2 [Candidatus Falkowbacteria bacterium]
MNISELARKLNISPHELRRILNMVGIHIGARAIKIDKKTAKQVIESWKKILADYKRMVQAEEDAAKQEKVEVGIEEKEITIPALMTVRDFAGRLMIPVNKLMEILMKNGIFASLNERIDFDTMAIIALELGVTVEKEEVDGEVGGLTRANYLKDLLEKESKDETKERPPVVVVMGHVDHGKTRLLDAIRKTNVIEGEAGGITQHIGAYQVLKNKRNITFIDTPGHEAFTAMRSRGARVADVAILVVAADDGVKPQTIEAIKIAEKSKLPFVVAINKIDKPEANIDKVKQELASHGVNPEDWGGKITCVPISAKEGTGVSDLLDMVLLTVDMQKDKLKISFEGGGVGTVIESHLDKGEGPVATALIQKGTLKKGDLININQIFAGKVRIMKDYNSRDIDSAGPSTPVRISGIKGLMQVGDILEATTKKGKVKKQQKHENKLEKFMAIQEKDETEDTGDRINILLKSDVLGSTEVIMESLEKIESKDIKIKIINRGLGNISEADVLQTEGIINNQHEDSRTMLVGFNVKISSGAEVLAKEKKVEIKSYQVIYDFLNEVKEAIKEMTKPEVVRTKIGEILVLGIFKTEKKSMVVGGKVTEGKVEKDRKIEVWRGQEKQAEGDLESLQSGKQEVSSVEKGQECGLIYKGEPIIQKEDRLLIFKESIKQ